jgi:hypothetical protein
MKDFLSNVDQKMQNLHRELTETIKKKTDGITDGRQRDTGHREKHSIHQRRYYLNWKRSRSLPSWEVDEQHECSSAANIQW